jgi:hypothetical protein
MLARHRTSTAVLFGLDVIRFQIDLRPGHGRSRPASTLKQDAKWLHRRFLQAMFGEFVSTTATRTARSLGQALPSVLRRVIPVGKPDVAKATVARQRDQAARILDLASSNSLSLIFPASCSSMSLTATPATSTSIEMGS